MIDHVNAYALPARDLRRSVAFYRDKLGFTLKNIQAYSLGITRNSRNDHRPGDVAEATADGRDHQMLHGELDVRVRWIDLLNRRLAGCCRLCRAHEWSPHQKQSLLTVSISARYRIWIKGEPGTRTRDQDESTPGAVPGELDALAADFQRAAILEDLLRRWPRNIVVPQEEPPRLLVPNANDLLVEKRGRAR